VRRRRAGSRERERGKPGEAAPVHAVIMPRARPRAAGEGSR
jgi:hypothetical protein